MSIVLSKVAEPYAEALLDLAKSNDSLKETTNDMNIVSQFLFVDLPIIESKR
jgi:F0F1-type ATP synthase delta subunit